MQFNALHVQCYQLSQHWCISVQKLLCVHVIWSTPQHVLINWWLCEWCRTTCSAWPLGLGLVQNHMSYMTVGTGGSERFTVWWQYTHSWPETLSERFIVWWQDTHSRPLKLLERFTVLWQDTDSWPVRSERFTWLVEG